MSLTDLPAVNACLNGLSAFSLTTGYVFIRRGNKIAPPQLHGVGVRNFSIFLICLSHLPHRHANAFTQSAHRIRNPEWFRPIYLVILFTHLALAVADCSDGVGHFESGDQRAVRTPQADRALDLAALDVCLRDRRGDLPAPLSNLPATVILVRKLLITLRQALTWFELFKTPQTCLDRLKTEKQ